MNATQVLRLIIITVLLFKTWAKENLGFLLFRHGHVVFSFFPAKVFLRKTHEHECDVFHSFEQRNKVILSASFYGMLCAALETTSLLHYFLMNFYHACLICRVSQAIFSYIVGFLSSRSLKCKPSSGATGLLVHSCGKVRLWERWRYSATVAEMSARMKTLFNAYSPCRKSSLFVK